MPYQRDGKRDYKKELEREHSHKPNRVKQRAERNRARAEKEKTTGKLPKSQHVDHSGPKATGSTRVVSAKQNLKKEGKKKSASK